MGKVRALVALSALALAIVGAASVAVAVQGGDKETAPVSEQSGKITFNTQTGAVGANPDRYKVPNGSELELTLDLDVKGAGEAEFASPPVRFPHGDPPSFHWRKVSATQVVLTELNNNGKPGEDDEYFFKARVSSGGEVHESPDPTIVNVGPPSGG